MDNQKGRLSQEELQEEFDRQLREVLSGAPGGMDEESLKAGIVLLGEIEARQTLLELLQMGMICAEIREDGVPVFTVCEGKVETTRDSEKAA